MIDEHDARTRHCPRLGHEVTFAYCRGENQGVPCRLTLDCWWERFDIRAFLRANFPPELCDSLENPAPPNKMASILDLIREARERINKTETR